MGFRGARFTTTYHVSLFVEKFDPQQPLEDEHNFRLLLKLIIYAGVLLFGFLFGFVPMWLQAHASAGRLADAERRLTLVGMQGDLASAAS